MNRRVSHIGFIFEFTSLLVVLKSTSDTLQGDVRRIKRSYINPLPLPKVVAEDEEKDISKLVLDLITKKAGTSRPERIVDLEEEIYKAVYSLYRFDIDDIQVVDYTINPV